MAIGRVFVTVVMAAFYAAGGYVAYLSSRLYQFRPGFAASRSYHLLFSSVPLSLLTAVALGVLFGASVEQREEPEIKDGKVLRHDVVAFLEHWTHATATVLLMVTGVLLGFLFVPRLLPPQPQTVGFVMNLHFVGVLVFLFGSFYYLGNDWVNGGFAEHMPQPGDFRSAIAHYLAKLGVGKAPEEGKYFASERLSFVGWLIGVPGIIVTGAVKVVAHVWSLPGSLMRVVTFCHDGFTLLMLAMLAAHVLLSSIVPWSWPLIGSMLTGYVSEEYARKHHEQWFAELRRGGSGKPSAKPQSVQDHGVSTNR